MAVVIQLPACDKGQFVYSNFHLKNKLISKDTHFMSSVAKLYAAENIGI